MAAPLAEAETGERPVLVLRAAGEWLALPVGELEEVLVSHRAHLLPHRRSEAVLGVANVRGELVPLISLAQVLGSGRARSAAGDGRLLVLRSDSGRLALLVDEVLGVRRYRPRQLRDVPATLAAVAGRFSSGLLELDDRSVALLDHEKLAAELVRMLG